jgi:hypothetical protein
MYPVCFVHHVSGSYLFVIDHDYEHDHDHDHDYDYDYDYHARLTTPKTARRRDRKPRR